VEIPSYGADRGFGRGHGVGGSSDCVIDTFLGISLNKVLFPLSCFAATSLVRVSVEMQRDLNEQGHSFPAGGSSEKVIKAC
jgi:hypothetical protein